jgi:hypothetical protein
MAVTPSSPKWSSVFEDFKASKIFRAFKGEYGKGSEPVCVRLNGTEATGGTKRTT